MKILSFGEIIIDIENEIKTVGGAPLNFAIHASRLGFDSYIYSAIGNDAHGQMAKEKIKNEGVQTHYLHPSDKPSATCILKNGGYFISEDCSFDCIPLSPICHKFDLIYIGTLAVRSPASMNTLSAILENSFDEVYFDINIRQNFYTKQTIDYLLSKATIFKASRDDLASMGERCHSLEEYCINTAAIYPNLKIILITLDSEGAMLYDCRTKSFIYKKPYPCQFHSAVGAGDGFSSAFISGYLRGVSLDGCLSAGGMMGAFVASRDGAIPEYTTELKNQLKEIYHGN